MGQGFGRQDWTGHGADAAAKAYSSLIVYPMSWAVRWAARGNPKVPYLLVEVLVHIILFGGEREEERIPRIGVSRRSVSWALLL